MDFQLTEDQIQIQKWAHKESSRPTRKNIWMVRFLGKT